MVHGSMPRYGYEDVGPRVKQYGHVESPADEEVDPRILEQQRQRLEQLRKQQHESMPQTRIGRRWTPDRGLVSEKAGSKVGETAARLPSGEIDGSLDLPSAPPADAPGQAVNLATAILPGGGLR
ncbi:MAG: hypothetical protein ACRC20_03170 [Segniliparus sp.]|uniref:hypothetical protein n=1 Tax=Segniliparus sp. TaxID=2804064 RepID=UPI003F324CF0